jgi:hypothetical protein
MSFAFRPQGNCKKSDLYFLRKNGPGSIGKWNYHKRRWTDSSIHRIGGQLHYLGSHAPYPVRKKWKIVEQKFMNRYRKVM